MPSTDQAVKPRIDLSRYELVIEGKRVKLERQPMELLIFLAERKSLLITREEIEGRLWGKDVFVDVNASINSAVRKIRQALKDDPAAPRYLETVVGKGYRFIGDVEVLGPAAPDLDLKLKPAQETAADTPPPSPRRNGPFLLALGLALAAVVGFLAVRWWREGRAFAGLHGPVRSVVVLPLENMSGDASQNFFADGMTDELTTDLAKIASLKVISRTSAMHYRGSDKSVKQIARELNVDVVIEGSVARSGDKVRITAQLIDAANDRHVWAESYEREVGDAITVQNTVALEIARQVRIRLSPSEQERLERHQSVNAAAYEAYLLGKYSQTTQSGQRLKEGLPAFQQAIALDPTYAPAYAGLADSYSLLANYGVLSPTEAFPQAEAAANKALELDPTLAEAHVALAYVEHHYNWHWAAAEQEYKTAIVLSPSYPTAHLRYAEYLSSVGRHDEAITEMRRAEGLDPLSLVNASNTGRFLYHARRYDDAIAQLKKVLDLDQGRTYARLHLAMSYEEKGMYEEARPQFKRVIEDFGGRSGPGVAHFDAVSGDRLKAKRILKQLARTAADSDWFFIAGAYAAAGEKDKAFSCLQRAYDKRDFFMVFLKVHPYMDPLRSDPRYGVLLGRVGMSIFNQ
jgi:TolB-like protein/DNA-binding winged helix-turn-helix (wHTH) protein/Tfp pilus assembly protein PilF